MAPSDVGVQPYDRKMKDLVINNMIKKVLKWTSIAVGIVFLASCSPQKYLTYLQDMEYGVPYNVRPMEEIHLQPGDQLSILVSCKQPELAIPFNIMSGSVSLDGSGSTTGLLSQGLTIFAIP